MSEIYAIPELREVLPAGAVPRHALFQLSSESKRQVRASTVVWHRPAPAVYRYMYVYRTVPGSRFIKPERLRYAARRARARGSPIVCVW